jgi:2-oxo-4-hydroxy-4-carboxy-5-ureidoimidazoline decarboxylase
VSSPDVDHRRSLTAQQFSLADFNRLDRDRAVELVRPCLGVERWWTAVVDGRPYPDLESLLEVARDAAYPLTALELEAALTQHLTARTPDPLSHFRAFTPADLADRLPSARLARRFGGDLEQYERRFGRPFIIRAAGRSTAEIADQLHTRLRNDVDTETKMVATQLRQIALHKLTHHVTD